MNVILSTIIWSPLLFALIAIFLPERNEEQRARVRTIALAGAGVSFFVTTFFAVLGQIGLGQGGGLASAYQENHTWFWNFVFQAHYDLVADGITLPLWWCHDDLRVRDLPFVEGARAGPAVCGPRAPRRDGRQRRALLGDFLLFAAFWGLLLVPMYLLIRIWGGDGARRAAAWFAGFQAVSLGLIIATTVIVVVEAGAQTSDMGAT